MRHGQIEMEQNINGNKQKWRWSHIHYQMCKKTANLLSEFTGAGLALNNNALFVAISGGTVTDETAQYNTLNNTLTLEITNDTITLTPIGGSTANDNLFFFTMENGTSHIYYLSDTTTNSYITNWNASTFYILEDVNGTLTNTGNTVTVNKNNNHWEIDFANVNYTFHFIQWNIRLLETNVPAPLTNYTYTVKMYM